MCSRMAPSKLEEKFVTLTPRDAPKFLQKFFRSSNEPIAPYTRLFRAPRFDMLGPSTMTILCSRFEDRKPSADGKVVMRCSSLMRLRLSTLVTRQLWLETKDYSPRPRTLVPCGA